MDLPGVNAQEKTKAELIESLRIGAQEMFNEEETFNGKHNDDSFIFINRDIDIKNPTVEDVISLMG